MKVKNIKKSILLLATACLITMVACDPETPVVTEWQRDYTANVDERTGALATVRDTDGNVYSVGQISSVTEEPNGDTDSYISAYTSTGETIFETRWDDAAYFGAPASSSILKIALDGNGNLYALGTAFLGNYYNVRMFLLRVNARGEITPLRHWEGKYDHPELRIENAIIYIAADLESNSGSQGSLVLQALKTDGTEIWSDSLTFSSSANLEDMQIKSERIIITANADSKAFIGAWNINGQQLWQQTFGENASIQYNECVMDDSLNVYTVGKKLENPADSQNRNHDFFMQKFNGQGELLWTETYSVDSDTDELAGLGDGIVFHKDRVIIAASSLRPGFLLDSVVFSLSAANGALLWERDFSISSSSINFTMDIAVAANGESTMMVMGVDILTSALSTTLVRTDANGNALPNKKLDNLRGSDLLLGPNNIFVVAGLQSNDLNDENTTSRVHHLILAD